MSEFFYYAMIACLVAALLLGGPVALNNGRDAFEQFDIALRWYGRSMIALGAGLVCLMMAALTGAP